MYSISKDYVDADWDAEVTRLPEANFLLSWAYAQAQIDAGFTTFAFLIQKDARVDGVCVAVLRPAKRGAYLEVAAPVLRDWSAGALDCMLTELKRLAREANCVFVRIRPQLEDSEQSRLLFTQMGMRPAHMHLYAEHTNIIDLSISEEGLLAAMRKQTRYEVKRAKKLGVKVTIAHDKSSYATFYAMQKETASRQGFVLGSNKKLLESEYNALLSAGQAILYQAHSKEGTLLNMAMVVNFGQEVDYLYGASTLSGQKLPGSYAVQWRAIMDAQKQGFERYNMWGIAPAGELKHRFAGVTTFKKGFGGVDTSYVPAHDLVISKPKYALTRLVEYTRKKRRNL